MFVLLTLGIVVGIGSVVYASGSGDGLTNYENRFPFSFERHHGWNSNDLGARNGLGLGSCPFYDEARKDRDRVYGDNERKDEGFYGQMHRHGRGHGHGPGHGHGMMRNYYEDRNQ